MSGAGFMCCRICYQRLEQWHDSDEGRVYEWEDHCPHCDLYRSEFHYGAYEERVGCVVSIWDHEDDGAPKNWREIESEAKAILASDTGYALFKATKEVNDRATAFLVFADWCQENGLILNEQYIRSITAPV